MYKLNPEGYFNINDIETQNELVQIRLIQSCSARLFQIIEECRNNLTPTQAGDNISVQTLPEGYTTEIPLRFAQILESNDVAIIEHPKVYKKQFREILRANACHINFSPHQNHFYELGLYLTKPKPNEQP